MIKQWLKHWLPSFNQVTSSKIMKLFGKRLQNPLLWYINRKSITKAVFIGAFFGLLPIPFHSVFIVLVIILFEANLPIGLTLAWLTNPLTIAPILYFGFWLGAKIYHVDMLDKSDLLKELHQITLWIEHFGHSSLNLNIAKVLVSGLCIEALLGATLLYLFTYIFWRLNIQYFCFKRQTSKN